MENLATIAAPSLWRRKKTYVWALIACGLIDPSLYLYGLAHPHTQGGLQMLIGFTLNVALLGWCFVDADERRVPISGLLGFLMLAVSIIGVPWYFLRSRGFLDALKAALGLGLYGIWLSAFIVGTILAVIVQYFIGA